MLPRSRHRIAGSSRLAKVARSSQPSTYLENSSSHQPWALDLTFSVRGEGVLELSLGACSQTPVNRIGAENLWLKDDAPL